MTRETLEKVQELREDKRNLPVALHVGSTVVILGAALVAMKLWPQLPVWLAAFVVIGFMQYRLVMAIHEATHKNLFFPVAVNEAFGKGLSGLLGMNFLLYRKSHLQHHKSPQKIGEDVDAPLYSPPLRVPPGLPRAWALLTGVVVSLFRKVLRKFTTRAQFGSYAQRHIYSAGGGAIGIEVPEATDGPADVVGRVASSISPPASRPAISMAPANCRPAGSSPTRPTSMGSPIAGTPLVVSEVAAWSAFSTCL